METERHGERTSEQTQELRCVVCRRTPTAVLRIRKQVGLVYIYESTSLKIPLCRRHGVQGSLRYLGSTLVLGWWGWVSFPLNFFAIGVDVLSLTRALRLAKPQRDSKASFALWDAARWREPDGETLNFIEKLPRLQQKRRPKP
jgi:hypothetical protein